MIKKSIVLLVAATLMPCGISVAQTASSAYGAGVHQYFSGRYQEAIMSFNSAIAEDPNDARAFYFRGLAQMGSGNSYAAEADFQQGATVETSARQRRSSLVSRSLERIQGRTRLRIESFRGNLGSPAVPVGGIAYGTPMQFNQAVVSQGFVSPTPCISQPIYQQPIVINSQPVSGERSLIESPVQKVDVAVEPVPDNDQVETFTFDGPVTSEVPTIVTPEQATPEPHAPPAQPGSAVSEAPQVEPVLSNSEAKSAAQSAVEQPAVEQPAPENLAKAVEAPAAVESPAIDNPAEVPAPATKEGPFGAETETPAATTEEPGLIELPNEDLPATEPAASEDLFGSELPAEERPAVIEEPATSEEPVNEADPFGDATPDSEPAALTEEPLTEEPLTEEPLTEEPASEADPFGAEEPASEQPVVIEEPATEEPASEADPFGAEEPAGDPVLPEDPAPIVEPAAEEPASESDPFGAETSTIEEPAGEEPAGDRADPFG